MKASTANGKDRIGTIFKKFEHYFSQVTRWVYSLFHWGRTKSLSHWGRTKLIYRNTSTFESKIS